MKRATEIADLSLKGLSCLAIIIAGAWALWIFGLGGSRDWQLNLSMDASVLPYRDDLRIVVVHVHAKNPRPITFQLSSKAGDVYELRVRQVARDKGANAVIDEDSGVILAKADLMSGTGDLYEFLPGAEMDDMRTFVLPVGTTVAITAEVTQHKGKRDEDSNSVSSVVHVADR
ncbi:hypothetical protein L2Y90_13055 [Burkholderia pyrrocinia]|uniref:hypothetical protein n=1 Tax=Burkholderia pyrrocinia TaxID=60550 RepID=UPI00215AC113|nr:hypothetical protein [Burkholderia pyrrocinia]UVE64777.1 hypothetical protein L2Y90_13055 [Burkholderia pyrrocinia]